MILKMINKIVALTIIFALVFEQSGFAQVAGPMGIPAYINGYISPDKFRPLQLRSLSFDQINNDFKLFLDKGDLRDLNSREIRENAVKLSEYFQIGLRLPNSTFWVNLRPDGQDQIIDPWLEKTDLGKVMLEADLQLKKDMANFTSPRTDEGKKYWDNLYKKAEELFGQSEITIPTLTRPWIVPGEILIRQTKDDAYIYKATLKVMLEQDYLKDSQEYKFADPRAKILNEYSSELIRQEILPKLTREVNSAKKYAGLRQVYYSLVLAQWFKQSHMDAGLQITRKIDSFDLEGLTSKKSWSKATYFQAYRKSFTKGEYKLQETVNRLSGTSVKQYFSGGERISITPEMFGFVGPSTSIINELADRISLPDFLRKNLIEIRGGNIKDPGARQLEKSDIRGDAGQDGGSPADGNGSMFGKMLPGLILTGAGLGLGVISGAASFGLLSTPLTYIIIAGIASFSFIASGVSFIRGGRKAAVRERANAREEIMTRGFLKQWPNQNIRGIVTFTVARKNGEGPRGYLAIEDNASTFLVMDYDYMNFAQAYAQTGIMETRALPQVPLILHSSLDGDKSFETVVAMLFVNPELSGAEVYNMRVPGKALISNWKVISRSQEEENDITGKISTAITKIESAASSRDGGINQQVVDEMTTKNLEKFANHPEWGEMIRSAKGLAWKSIRGTVDARGEITMLSPESTFFLKEYAGEMKFEIIDGKVKSRRSPYQAINANYSTIMAVLEGTFQKFDPDQFSRDGGMVRLKNGDEVSSETVSTVMKKLLALRAEGSKKAIDALYALKEIAAYPELPHNYGAAGDYLVELGLAGTKDVPYGKNNPTVKSIRTLTDDVRKIVNRALRFSFDYSKENQTNQYKVELSDPVTGVILPDQNIVPKVSLEDFADLVNNKDGLKDKFITEKLSGKKFGLFDFMLKQMLAKFRSEGRVDASLISAGPTDMHYAQLAIAFLEAQKPGKDGGTVITSAARVKELCSAINEISFTSSPNEDFMVKRLARVEALIKEKRYTTDEIGSTQEWLKFANPVPEWVTAMKMDSALLAMGSAVMGGLTIGAFLLSGLNLWPMIIGIGMASGFGLGAAYRLYKLFTRDIPLRDFNNEYYSKVGKMLAEANRDGGRVKPGNNEQLNKFVDDVKKSERITGDVLPKLLSKYDLNSYAELSEAKNALIKAANTQRNIRNLGLVFVFADTLASIISGSLPVFVPALIVLWISMYTNDRYNNCQSVISYIDEKLASSSEKDGGSKRGQVKEKPGIPDLQAISGAAFLVSLLGGTVAMLSVKFLGHPELMDWLGAATILAAVTSGVVYHYASNSGTRKSADGAKFGNNEQLNKFADDVKKSERITGDVLPKLLSKYDFNSYVELSEAKNALIKAANTQRNIRNLGLVFVFADTLASIISGSLPVFVPALIVLWISMYTNDRYNNCQEAIVQIDEMLNNVPVAIGAASEPLKDKTDGGNHRGMDLSEIEPVGILKVKLESESYLERERTARKLGEMNAKEAYGALEEALKKEKIRPVRNTIAYAMAKIDRVKVESLAKDATEGDNVCNAAKMALSALKRSQTDGGRTQRIKQLEDTGIVLGQRIDQLRQKLSAAPDSEKEAIRNEIKKAEEYLADLKNDLEQLKATPPETWDNGRIEKGKEYRIKGNSEYFREDFGTANPIIIIDGPHQQILGGWYEDLALPYAGEIFAPLEVLMAKVYWNRMIAEGLPDDDPNEADVFVGRIFCRGMFYTELVHKSELEEYDPDSLQDGGTKGFSQENAGGSNKKITVFRYDNKEIASLIAINNDESVVVNKNGGYIAVEDDRLVMVSPDGKKAWSSNAPLVTLVKKAKVMSEQEWDSGNMVNKKDGGVSFTKNELRALVDSPAAFNHFLRFTENRFNGSGKPLNPKITMQRLKKLLELQGNAETIIWADTQADALMADINTYFWGIKSFDFNLNDLNIIAQNEIIFRYFDRKTLKTEDKEARYAKQRMMFAAVERAAQLRGSPLIRILSSVESVEELNLLIKGQKFMNSLRKLRFNLIELKALVNPLLTDNAGAFEDFFNMAFPSSRPEENDYKAKMLKARFRLQQLLAEASFIKDEPAIAIVTSAKTDQQLILAIRAQQYIVHLKKYRFDINSLRLFARDTDRKVALERIFAADKVSAGFLNGQLDILKEIVERLPVIPSATPTIAVMLAVDSGNQLRLLKKIQAYLNSRSPRTNEKDGGSNEQIGNIYGGADNREAGLKRFDPYKGARGPLITDSVEARFGLIVKRYSKLAEGERLELTENELGDLLWRLSEAQAGTEGFDLIAGIIGRLTESNVRILKDIVAFQALRFMDPGKLSAKFELALNSKDGGNKKVETTGGVDFRALPAIVTPMANPASAGAGLLSLKDLDKQWSQIQSKIYQGEMPYQEIKLYVSSCCGQKAAVDQLEQVSEGITNILKMEEDRALPTAPELKEILSCLG